MKMHRAMVLLVAALPLAAMAQTTGDITYTWAEARLVTIDPDRGGDLDGLRLAGSSRIEDNFFATGGVTLLSADGGGDVDLLDLGIGLRHPVDSATDVFGVAGLLYADPDRGDDDTGLSLTGGVRSMVATELELAGYLTYAELYGDGDFALAGDVFYYVTPNLALLGGLALSDDERTLSLGARWSFVPTR